MVPRGRPRYERKEKGNGRRSHGRKFHAILSTILLFLLVERNDRLKPGPSEHVHFFVNCQEVNDPEDYARLPSRSSRVIERGIKRARCRLRFAFSAFRSRENCSSPPHPPLQLPIGAPRPYELALIAMDAIIVVKRSDRIILSERPSIGEKFPKVRTSSLHEINSKLHGELTIRHPTCA